jgi:hypothetical protein
MFVAMVVFSRYGNPYAQYDALTHLGHVKRRQSRLVVGFSTNQHLGRNQSRISCTRSTRLSASMRSRGLKAELRAMEYCSQGQLAQITS